jgi:carbamoyl-phosphate synthase large subunit
MTLERHTGIPTQSVGTIEQAISDSFTMRREALQHRVTYYTTMAGARAACYALGELDAGDVNCLQDLHKSLK